jgi:drug/metabolite transporter (DMT)-like permease
LAGGVFLLILAAVTGEMRGFHLVAVSWGSWFALGYLVAPGSIMGFTAYLWLLHYESPTRVGTYAYVNPVVAVILGYLFGGEALGMRTILATVLILISVLVIATAAGQKRMASRRQPAPRVSSTIGS